MTPYSTTFYSLLVGHPCESWDAAQAHANEIVQATGENAEPSYDGNGKHSGQLACVRIRDASLTATRLRRPLRTTSRPPTRNAGHQPSRQPARDHQVTGFVFLTHCVKTRAKLVSKPLDKMSRRML